MSILFEVIEGVGKITFNRPESYNSVNREVALAFQAKLKEWANDSEVRAIYLTGNGKAFGAGQDLNEIMQPNMKLETIVTEHYNPIILQLRSIPKPVVAAVNGVAAGASANIALACDIVVAKESATFLQAFSKIGLIPDSGGTFTLPRLIGFQKASALIMLADKISATEAERLGMIYKVFTDVEFEEASWKIATKLAKMPTKALAYIKHALNQSFNNSLEDQLALEGEYQVKASETADYKEGVTAFLEKRKPEFKGV